MLRVGDRRHISIRRGPGDGPVLQQPSEAIDHPRLWARANGGAFALIGGRPGLEPPLRNILELLQHNGELA